MGVAAHRDLFCDCGSTAKRPQARLGAGGEKGRPVLSWELAGQSQRRSGPLSLQGLAHRPRAPKDGLLYASGVLCRESLANRDKLQCPSTSPGSLEL